MITKHEQRLRIAAECVRDSYRVTEAMCPDVTSEVAQAELQAAKDLANSVLKVIELSIGAHRHYRCATMLRTKYYIPPRVARIP